MLEWLTIIAQEGGGGGSGGGASGCGPESLILFAMFGAVFYFMVLRPQSKDKKKRTDMLAALKKNDRIVTIGGVTGTVMSVKEDEVTVKVDESNNTKITFVRSAIQSVTAAGASEESSGSGDKK
jgi:preprotein translocase subunit YajC